MERNKRFSDEFRYKTFGELRDIGECVSNVLSSVVQNPVPMSDTDIGVFNALCDSCIERLSNVKESINDENKSDRLVDFEE